MAERELLLQAYENQDIPLAEVLQMMGAKDERFHLSLFEVALGFEELHGPSLDSGVPFKLLFSREGNSLVASLRYEGVPSTLAKQSLDCILTILRAGLDNTAALIKDLPLMPDQERQLMLNRVGSAGSHFVGGVVNSARNY